MQSDIKLDNDVVIIEGQFIKTSVTDLMLDSPERRKNNIGDRRALVHDFNDGLTLNYNKDYPNGVKIEGQVLIPESIKVNKIIITVGETLDLSPGKKIVLPNGEVIETQPSVSTTGSYDKDLVEDYLAFKENAIKKNPLGVVFKLPVYYKPIPNAVADPSAPQKQVDLIEEFFHLRDKLETDVIKKNSSGLVEKLPILSKPDPNGMYMPVDLIEQFFQLRDRVKILEDQISELLKKVVGT